MFSRYIVADQALLVPRLKPQLDRRKKGGPARCQRFYCVVRRDHLFPSLNTLTTKAVSMLKMLIAVVAASLGLAGSVNTAAADLFSRTGPVIAIMENDLFVGEAEGHLSGAGTIAIHSQREVDVTCAGPFTSSAELGGSGQMQCSDGTTGTYHFKRLSLVKGYGIGICGRRSMSFTYGLTLDESKPYLKLPPGKKLEHNGKKLALVDIPPAALRRPISIGGRRAQPGS